MTFIAVSGGSSFAYLARKIQFPRNPTLNNIASHVYSMEHRTCTEAPVIKVCYEMLLIRKKKPSLNTQSDSIRAKLF